jgi:hypothetical protein
MNGDERIVNSILQCKLHAHNFIGQ